MAINPTVSSSTSVTVTGLSTLASVTYVAGSSVNHTTNNPVDVVYMVSVTTTNTPTGNKQLKVFLKISMDGTTYTTGPSSGTTTTDEPDLYFLGVVPVNTISVAHAKAFSIGQAVGFIPKSSIIVLQNDLGVALTAGSVEYTEISIP